MWTTAWPMIDAAGQRRGWFRTSRQARFLDRRQPRRELLGEVEFRLVEPRLGAHRPFRVGDLEQQARTVDFAGLRGRRDRQRRRVFQLRAVGRPGTGRTPGRWRLRAGERARDRHRAAVRRVEREPGRLIMHIDVLDLQREAFDDARDRVRPDPVGRDRERRGRRVDFDLRPDDSTGRPSCRSNGPAFAGLTMLQAERGARVGAGQVDLAAGDGEWVLADADADDRFADLRFRTAGARVRLGFRAQRHARQHPRHPRRVCAARTTASWLTVFAAERRRQRAEPTRVVVRRAATSATG